MNSRDIERETISRPLIGNASTPRPRRFTFDLGWRCRHFQILLHFALFVLMADIKIALRVRIRPADEECGFCGKKIRPVTALRRHIKTSPGHENYAQQILWLHKQGSRLPRKGPDRYREVTGGADRTTLPPATIAEPLPDDSSRTNPLTSGGSKSFPKDVPPALPEKTIPDGMHDIECCPPRIKEMWEAAGGMPVLIPTEATCPVENGHTDFALFKRFFVAEPTKVQVFVNGIASHAPTTQRREELSSLVYSYVSDRPVTSRVTASLIIERDVHFYVPQIDGDPVPQLVEDTEAIWAATGGNTPAHIGSFVIHKLFLRDLLMYSGRQTTRRTSSLAASTKLVNDFSCGLRRCTISRSSTGAHVMGCRRPRCWPPWKEVSSHFLT